MGGKVREVGEGMPVDIFDLTKKIEDLTVQEPVVDVDVTILSRSSDKVLAIQELRENELKELKSNISEMEKERSKLQVMKREFQERSSVLNDECTRLKETEETLKKEFHDARAVTRSLKKDIEHLSNETRTSDEDAAILEKNQSLLWLYKNLTGVKWDYTAPSSGYVGSGFNSVKNYCKYFSYPAAEASSECVWDEIQCAAHADWSDISR